MSVTAETLRRIAAMPPEAMSVTLLFVAEQLEADEARKSKERERKRRGKSADNPSGSMEMPRKDAERNDAVVDNPPSTSQKEAGKVKTTAPLSRGSRLPDDFQPLPSILELARNRGLTDGEYWEEFDRFKDYWRGVPGQRGCKADWQATWRNRVKEMADRKKVRTNGTANRPSPGQTMRDAIRDVGEHIRGHGKAPGSVS